MGRKRVSKQLELRSDWLWLSSESVTWWVVCVRNCWGLLPGRWIVLVPSRASA